MVTTACQRCSSDYAIHAAYSPCPGGILHLETAPERRRPEWRPQLVRGNCQQCQAVVRPGSHWQACVHNLNDPRQRDSAAE